jgi:hypothetical protein
MTQSNGFARITLSSARWLLPWIAVLFASISLAYATTGAMVGGVSAGDQGSKVHAFDAAVAPSGITFELMSTSSPALSGHASSDGCCTWD